MRTIHLTRKQYDQAVTTDPRFMSTTYRKMDRNMSFNGVTVSGLTEDITHLLKIAAQEAR